MAVNNPASAKHAKSKAPVDFAIDFTQALIDPMSGSPMVTPTEDGKTAPLTLGRAAAQALFYEDKDSRASGEDKFRRAMLACRIKDDPAAVLTVDEVALIKTRIGVLFFGNVLAAAWPILDPSLKP